LQKPVSSATYAPSSHMNLGAATTANVKASAGYVYTIYCINRNAAVRYFQLHNTATTPAGGATAQNTWAVPAGTTDNPGILILDTAYFSPSERFATGIAWAISTAEATYAAATAGDHSVRVRYA